jgi:hypothetical protein
MLKIYLNLKWYRVMKPDSRFTASFTASFTAFYRLLPPIWKINIFVGANEHEDCTGILAATGKNCRWQDWLSTPYALEGWMGCGYSAGQVARRHRQVACATRSGCENRSLPSACARLREGRFRQCFNQPSLISCRRRGFGAFISASHHTIYLCERITDEH